MYAIIQKGSHQYKVTAGMEFDIYNIDAQAGDKLTVKEVLMIVDDTGEIKVGQPYIEKASVDLKINGSKKGKKVNVMRFKAKSRYTKRRGFREDLTVVSVESINV
ncbi:50S ribosomal protein L21 [Candidatus Gottesmanbacteria bacterium]|nr:50S ribosomal protein L21 [Candidatus Gottesmanbacteria bacterium]